MNTPLSSCRPVRHAALMTLLALLVGCGGYGHHSMNTPTNVTISGAVLPTLKTMTPIGSTLDSIEMGGNPYGLTVATANAGLITMGDLIVCNFNDGATNTQGLGTTVVGLHPTAGAVPYRIAQSTQLLGCSAITSLPDGSLVATASQANATVLVAPSGTVSTPSAPRTVSPRTVRPSEICASRPVMRPAHVRGRDRDVREWRRPP